MDIGTLDNLKVFRGECSFFATIIEDFYGILINLNILYLKINLVKVDDFLVNLRGYCKVLILVIKGWLDQSFKHVIFVFA